MNRTSLFTCCLILASTVVPTQALDPNAPGDLSVIVFASPTEDFITEWVSTPATHSPTIRRISEARTNELVHVGFIVTGYTRSDDDTVRLQVDVAVRFPDGRALFEQRDFSGFKGKPKSESAFVLADPVLLVMIESGDPLGTYTIEATVRDLATGKSQRGIAELTITK